MENEFPEMPCGCCDEGTYSVTPALNGLAKFGECATRKAALKLAPRCKHDASHICWGARDWIRSTPFPMTEADREQIRRDCAR